MNKNLLSKLEQISNEEQFILQNRKTNIVNSEIDENEVLFNDNSINIKILPRFIDYPFHTNDGIELMYVVQGIITHKIENKEIVLKKGDLLLLSHNSSHAITKCTKDDIAVSIVIHPSFFNIVYEMIGYDNFIALFLIDLLRNKENSYLIFNTLNISQIQNLIENLVQSFFDQQGNTKENQITLSLIFLYLIRNIDCIKEGSSQNFEDLLIENTLEYINISYKNANLHEISSLLHQNDYNLSKLIKTKTGRTFKELLQSRRFYQAEELLLNSNLAIDEIILAVGYESHSYFFKRFKEKYGVTPKKYRQLHG